MIRDSGLDVNQPQNPLFNSLIAEEVTGNGIQPVAYASFSNAYSARHGRTLFISDLFIRGGHRGSGLGTRIFYELLKIAKRNHCHFVEMHVELKNQLAIKFYERFCMINVTNTEGFQLYAIMIDEEKALE